MERRRRCTTCLSLYVLGCSTSTQDEATIWYALSRNDTMAQGDRQPSSQAPTEHFSNTLRFCLNSGSGISLLDVGHSGEVNENDNGNNNNASRAVDSNPDADRMLMWGISDFQAYGGLQEKTTTDQKIDYVKSLFDEESTPLVRDSLQNTSTSGVYETRLFERNSATSWVKVQLTVA